MKRMDQLMSSAPEVKNGIDSMVGKTSLFLAYQFHEFPAGYVPKISDSVQTVRVDGDTVCLQLWDSPGSQEYDGLRPAAHPSTDVFLVCFSLVSPESYENIRIRWKPELVRHCPDTPFILVGTKLDLRDDAEAVQKLRGKDLAPISYSQGLALMKEVGAVRYLECSALTGMGIPEVLDEAARVALTPSLRLHYKRKNSCALI